MNEELSFSAIRARMSVLSKDLEINSVKLKDNTTLNVNPSKLHRKSAAINPEGNEKERIEICEVITSKLSIRSFEKQTKALEIPNSFPEEKKSTPKFRPPVPQKPKKKSFDINGSRTSENVNRSSCQILLLATSKNESAFTENKPISVSSTENVREERITREQHSLTVNKLRLQFEEKTNLHKPAGGNNFGSRNRVPEPSFTQTSGTIEVSHVDDNNTEVDNSYRISAHKKTKDSLQHFKQKEFIGNEKQIPIRKEIQTNFYSNIDDVTYEDSIYENIDLNYQPYKGNEIVWHDRTPQFGYHSSRTAKSMSEALILEEQHESYNQQASAYQNLSALMANPPRQAFDYEDLDDEFDDEFDNQEPTQEPIYSNYVYTVNSGSTLQDLPRLPSKKPRQRSSYAEAFAPVKTRPPQLKSSISFNHCGQVRNQFDENRIKCNIQLDHIMEELIKTEEHYVQTLLNGIANYITRMFSRKDLPRNLQGKQIHLFGTIEGIAAFHSDILLPMFRRNKNNTRGLFDEFSLLIKNRYMYNYVLYTMNRRRSQEYVQKFAPYFAYIQEELGEKLGIESFLLQPVQRLPRYELLLKEFLKTLFTANISKEHLRSCCALENGLRNLLCTANEADKIVDIANWADLNICNPNNEFRKVLDLYIFDLDRHSGYAGKVFVFEKCMIYTQIISDNNLVYRGCFDATKKIDLIPTKNSFRMSQRGCQVLEFRPNSSDSIQFSIKFIEAMIDYNSKDELVSNCIDCNIRHTSADRNSNRSDSGLGWDNIM